MHRCRGRSWRLFHYLLGCVVFCWVSWAALTSRDEVPPPRVRARGLTTIVAYSEEKLAELERPNPVTCDTVPATPRLVHFNRTWARDGGPGPATWQRVAGGRVALYAAYYDRRTTQHYVRILAMYRGRKISPNESLYCQTRPQNVQDTSIEVVAAKPIEIWWHQWDPSSDDVETPVLLSCPLTDPLLGPSIVSVVTQPCNDPSNAFLLNPNEDVKYKRNFTVCVKDMNFQKDISGDLMEWIEMNRLLGAEKIDMYVEKINENVEEVLEYYRTTNFVRLFQIPINSTTRSLWQRRRDHIITYNDCLYRNIHETKYLIPLDIDEIILPKIAYSWSGLVRRLEKTDWNPSRDSAILIKNVFFFDFMQNLDNNKRANHRPHENKTYVKRDDVRLTNLNSTEFLVYSSVNSSGDVVSDAIAADDVEADSVTLGSYRYGCGKVPVPRSVRNVVRSAIVSPAGHYTKSMMVTRRVLTAFNHYPLASVGGLTVAGWTAPFSEVQLNHYKESCNSVVMDDCGRYGRRAIVDTAALRMRRRLLRALAKVRCTQNNKTKR